MSHSVTLGTTMPLSQITLAGLVDLNYTVDYSKAEPFSATRGCCGNSRRNDRRNEEDGLSEEGLEKATEFGLSILQDLTTRIKSDDYYELAADRVSVLFLEGGKLYTVLVEAS
jgi:hypothetical protein